MITLIYISVSDVLSGLNFNNSQQQYPDQQQQYPHQPFQPQQQMSSRAQACCQNQLKIKVEHTSKDVENSFKSKCLTLT